MVQTGSAGKHWYTERVASVGLLALIPAGFVYPNPVVDYGLAVLIPLHGHWSVTVCMHTIIICVLMVTGLCAMHKLVHTISFFQGLYGNSRGLCA